ncbi:MAG TPA: chemotaxis protein CheB [Bryobacteraceae bacterium]|jgi:two-component system CheB/CheR fusion protein|nr:chemotaxis protein CheB [Bryobacteraceae bacterium]
MFAPDDPISTLKSEEDRVALRPALEMVHVDHGSEADISPPRGHAFPIIGVGASAGGLDAFTRLLKALPPDTGMAFVLVQHLDPHHTSQLPEILASATSMPVRTVEDGMAVCPNEVFVIPPNSTMVLEDGVLRLAQRSPGLHMPIDAFFESLARVQGGRAIGIVLSGNASDGSQGVRAIKEECGLTFAQDEASAQHIGMPRNAIATGAIDYVLPPVDIAKELVHLSQHPFVRPAQSNLPEEEMLPEGDGDLNRIFNALRANTKVDFRHYKRNTVRRRIGRRMIVKHTRSLDEYARILEDRQEEARELYRDLLISVTNFFRDADVFVELSRLLKDILSARDSSEAFRVWVPGCATGEELYSLAICLKEVLDDLQLDTPLQLFGTDISEIALDRARAGTYLDNISQDVSAERLRRFFIRVDRGHQVNKSIRENCVFARQDVTTDPPFGHTDLISCRNLLIYLDSTLQRKVLPVFHYSLNPTGLLLLGSAESIAAASDLFTVIDKQHRIYGRKAAPLRLTLQGMHGTTAPERSELDRVRTTLSGIDLQKKTDLIIQSKYAPAAVVVDADLQILQFRGRTGFYLEPPSGEATLNLVRMARENLAVPLRRATEAAGRQNVSTRETGIGVEYRGERREINIEVTPIAGAAPGERYFLVVFEETTESAPPVRESIAAAEASLTPSGAIATLEARVRELRQQLAETREYLRNSNEDHEASSEELRAANEEVRSANEELQSTNEELSTTKEELQSANEELTTLNEELQTRNQELDALNNDLLNLLSAVDIAFVMVDNELRLRRFSTAAEKTLNVRSIDIGHPLTSITGRIDLATFQEPMRKVIETLNVERWDTQDKDGRWFTATVRPYRTVDNRIAGAVVVFVDIDPLKRTLRAAEEARDYAEGMIETVREPLLVLDRDLRVQRATAAFYNAFQVSRGETEERLLYDLGNGQWNRPRLRERIGDALFHNRSFQDFEIVHDFPHIGRRTMRLNARRISRDHDDHPTVLLAIEDVTERREEAEERYHRLFETAKDGMLLFDAETEKLTDVNPFVLELTGYGRERLVGCRINEMEVFRDAGEARNTIGEAKSHEIVRHEDIPLLTIDRKRIEVELVANRYSVGGQEVVQVNIRDVTRRNQAVRARQETEERFRLLVDSVRDYALFQMDLNGRITSWNSGAERMLGYSESEIVGGLGARVFTPEDLESGEPEKELEMVRRTGKSEAERWQVRKDGARFFASGVLTTVQDEAGHLRGFAKVMRDITERRTAEEQIRASLREKEILLKEIHHRVKNNLQMIASLLSLQTEYLGHSKTVDLLEDMKGRVRSIAAIHEMLYGSADLSRIDFAGYLNALAKDLLSFYSGAAGRVDLNIHSEPEFLEITQAVPCGLLVNELLTNSLKHAFPDRRAGAIKVTFSCPADECRLVISDDGIGLPPELDPQNSASMGFQLVMLLVQQLKGTLTIDRGSGTRSNITFAKKAILNTPSPSKRSLRSIAKS